MSTLADLVISVAREAGGIRALSRAIGLCPGYLCRMSKGEKINPSEETLEALGLARSVSYSRKESRP